ncbi:hypothetical protein [Enterococcus mundtii]|uniref:hypothetical protein n=1 Tax=Enterococcus mundtii TaxID=53346 RepID=UPI0035BECD5D
MINIKTTFRDYETAQRMNTSEEAGKEESKKKKNEIDNTLELEDCNYHFLHL